MRRGTPLGVALLVLVAAAIVPRPARAQGQIQLVVPPDAPLPAAPVIGVRAIGFAAPAQPLRIRLRLGLSSGLGLVLYDSTKVGTDATFTTQQLLPENREIFAEATVFDAQGVTLSTLTASIGSTGPRLSLLDPTTSGVPVGTQQPRFSWRSAPVTTPPGPWVYDLYITNVATQETIVQRGITDSVYNYPDTLQANTSYRWRLVAKLKNGMPSDSVVVSSQSSFVIAPANQPLTTLLYQNFPNPFPSPRTSSTCIWFDLRTASEAELTIYDLRGNRVRRLLPSPELRGVLPAGRYGRLNEIDPKQCDPRFAWDGTADNGRIVPPGVYLVRFRADGYESMKKMLFRGR